MSKVVEPKIPTSPHGSSTSGPTPVADFIEKAMNGLMLAILGPIMTIVFVAAPAAALVFWIAQPTGLLAAWSALVIGATGPNAPPLAFAASLAQDLIFGAALALIMALPSLRKALESYKLKWLAEAIGSPAGVAAVQVGVTCLALHVMISGLVAAALAGVGVVLPAPGGVMDMILPLQSFIAAGGGGWPPAAGDLGGMAIVVWTVLVIGGAIIGAACGAAIWSIAAMTGRAAIAGAASGGASGLGALLVHALTDGEHGQANFREAVGAGMSKGLATGAVYALIVLAGAAVFGVR